jgi:hypothetical protein
MIYFCLNFPFNNSSYHNYINSKQHYNFNKKLYKFYFFKKKNIRNKKTLISIDIDNQKYNISPVEGNKDLYQLVVFIAQFLEGNNQNYSLNQIILNFKEKINKNITPSIYLKDDDDIINFFEINNEINIIIQEIFYDFCLNLFLLFYYDNIYSSEDNKIKDNSKKNKSYIVKQTLQKDNSANNYIVNIIKEEQIFFNKFRETEKYEIFFIKYMRNFVVEDIFKFNYILYKEFIQIKIDTQKLIFNESFPYFKIIDNIFVNNNKNKNINLSSLNEKYNDELSKIKNCFEEYEKNENELIIMNKNLIYNLVYELKSYSKEKLITIFPNIKDIDNNIISETNIEQIYDIIQNEMIKSQIINANEFLYYSIIKIILMTMTLYKENQLNDIIILFRIILNQINTYKHYYIYIILKVFQKYNKKNKPNQNTINAIFNNIKDYIKENDIIPNKEIIDILSVHNNDNMPNNINIINNNNENLELKDKYAIYNKNNFTNKGIFHTENIIEEFNKSSYESSHLKLFASDKKILVPKIIGKFNEKIYETNFYSFFYIFNQTNKLFEIFFNENLDIKKTNKKSLISFMLNVIQYSKALFRINNNLNNYLVKSLILIDKIKFDNNIINEENNSVKEIINSDNIDLNN